MSAQASFACFECRRSYKGRICDSSWRCTPVDICPECGGKTTPMGKAFKPPARNKLKEWARVELSVIRKVPLDATHTLRQAGIEGERRATRSDCEKVEWALKRYKWM